MKPKRKELKEIDGLFFDIEQDVAKVVLQYDRFEDIMDPGYVSKLPVLSSDFIERIGQVFDLVSSKYKIDLTLRFDDLQGHTEEEVSELLKKNFKLHVNSDISVNKKRNRIGYVLLTIGGVCLLAMLAVQHLWLSESVLHDIFFYIFDIATTVLFWEALTILVVEQAENKAIWKNINKRLEGLHFETKDQH